MGAAGGSGRRRQEGHRSAVGADVGFPAPWLVRSHPSAPPPPTRDPGWRRIVEQGRTRSHDRLRAVLILVWPPHPSPEYLVTVNLILSATARILSRFWEPKVQGFRNGIPGGSPSMITEPGLLLIRL